MSEPEERTTLRGAAGDLSSSIGQAVGDFWSDLMAWLGDLRLAYKVLIIGGGYLISDFLLEAAGRILVWAATQVSVALGQADVTVSGLDFLFLIVYLQVLTMILVSEMMRRINKLATEVEDMSTDQTRPDGGQVTDSSSKDPFLSRLISSRAFWFAAIGFAVGFPFGYQQAAAIALTAGFAASILWPSE